MTRQTQVFIEPPVGVEGGIASTNPIRSVPGGPGGFVANGNGARIGYFNWIQADGTVAAFQPSPASTGPKVPDGVILNEGQAQITDFLGQQTMVIQSGQPLTLIDRADLWVRNWFATANRGAKAFANIFTGQVAAGDPGAFVVDDIESASFTGHITQGTNLLTVTAVASGTITVGSPVYGPSGDYVGTIAAEGSGTGSTGTYFLNEISYLYPTATAFQSLGWSTGASFNADYTGTTMTVNSVDFGAILPGMFVKGTGITPGTYVSANGTGSGGVGTYTLSQSVTTETSETVTATPFVETPWYVESNGNAGDLVIIGIKN